MDDSVTLTEATTAIEPISSHRPDAKTRRYDRQLRLWASSGQQSLESANVLLVGADAPGCQALKNLVLPGIAKFTILTNAKVRAQDISTNFFLLPESLDLSLASETAKLLKELNPSVEGIAEERSLAGVLETDSTWFESFDLIILCGSGSPDDVGPKVQTQLKDLVWKRGRVPVISFRTSGFVAMIRTQFNEHCVIDTHPDHAYTLRIDQPFEQLEKYALGLDLDGMDSMEHSHVPYVVLLIRALKTFQSENGGDKPKYETIEAFKEVLSRERRAIDEENFAEAEGQAFAVTQISEIPTSTKKLMEDSAALEVTKDSKDFWLLVKALKAFVEHASNTSGLLPLSAALPDMHTSTASYINLQNLYKKQATADANLFKKCLTKVLVDFGLDPEAISETDADEFVKHCHTLLCERGSQSKGELSVADVGDDFVTECFESTHGIATLLAFHLAEKHHLATQTWPGTVEDEYHTLKAQMFDHCKTILNLPELGTNVDRDEDGKLFIRPAQDEDDMDEETEEDSERREETRQAKIVQDSIDEVCRGGMDALPTTSAVIGGLVAQEAIKLITKQYSPLNGTCVIDLVKGGMTRYTI